MLKKFLSTTFLFLLATQNCSAKDRPLHIVGSSTISPFMAAVSEEFSRSQDLKNLRTKTPLVESTGSSNGFKTFCSADNLDSPDFIDASRPIKEEEEENCSNNGVKQLVEIKIGYDGIVVGNFIKNKKIKLTKEQIFLALAEKVYDKKSKKLVNNFYQTWDQIDASLPKRKILVYGPPLTSGTREVFADLMLEEVCFRKKEFVENYPDYLSRKKQCHSFRKDGKFIESGENDQAIIDKIKNDPDAFGIFGFNFLIENKQTIQAVEIDGVTPSYENIASKRYKLSRPLFVYFKKDNLNSRPQMRDFILEIISEETIGKKGYLVNNGLVPLSDAELHDVRQGILSQL
ncbi:MAG: substrate-binding domain-containing protein [Proteobacteria bacterium]|nr:substrate-binding domain-containing protein [Pseudomonadota bacterium]